MPKYKLIKDLPHQKADDTEWEGIGWAVKYGAVKYGIVPGDHILGDRMCTFESGEKELEWDGAWGDPIASGWFEEVKPKRFRANINQAYFFFDDGIKVFETREGDDCLDEARFNSGNYFRTREQAQEAANRIKKLLAELQEEISKE